MLRTALFAIACAAITSAAYAVGPTVDIVIGEKADPLEKFAAEEMAGQLKKLFDAEVRIGVMLPNGGSHLVFVGTNGSNAFIAKHAPTIPALKENEILLKSIPLEGKSALVVAGGDARAVLWAVREFGESFGIRNFNDLGDLYPSTSPEFSLNHFDFKSKSAGPTSVYFKRKVLGDTSPLGHGTWGLNEFRVYLRHLAKDTAATEVDLNVGEWKQGRPYSGPLIATTGDTAGRAAFKGEKFFDNPEFASQTSDAGRRMRAERLIDEIVAAGNEVGIVVKPFEKRVEDKVHLVSLLPRLPDWRTNVSRRVSAGRSGYGVLQVYEDLLNPICGTDVAPRVVAAAEFEWRVPALIDHYEASDVTAVRPQMLLMHFDSDEPPPAWWGEARTSYLNAMNEMYRANTRAREGGRTFTLYYARRFEFAFEYMNAIEAIRKAGIAKRKGDKDTQIAELEKAIDSVTNACNAMAAVARSPSDRGVIAVMNEYGYRPLLKLLEEADAAQ
ncbi:MAG: hypothetical protein C0483_19395 [Pirellula sp.]|nr:hypothetical protein [Pirellula sp.]